MKLSSTKSAIEASKIQLLDDIYMKSMPMSKMQAFFKDLSKIKDDEQENMINSLFKEILVDSDGNQFEDLVNELATDVLSVPLIIDLMSRITEAVNPSEGK